MRETKSYASPELLKEAREWTCKKYFPKFADEIVPTVAEFAALKIRECMEIARDAAELDSKAMDEWEEGWARGCVSVEREIAARYGLDQEAKP